MTFGATLVSSWEAKNTMGRINKSFSSAAYYGVEKEQAAALF